MMERTMKKKTRFQTLGMFDLAKGIAFSYVVIGHTITHMEVMSPYTLGQTNQTSMLSVLGQGLLVVFFLASGYGFRVVSQKKCVQTQAKLMLRPYFYTALAVSVYKILTSLLLGRSLIERGWGTLLAYVFGITSSPWTLGPVETDSIGATWFFPALFWAWIILNGILRRKNQTAEIVLTLTCVVAGFLMLLPGISWPFCLQQGLLAVGYLYIGYQIKKRKLLEKKLHPLVYVLLAAVSLGSILRGDISMMLCTWKLGLYDYAASVCLGFLLLKAFAALHYRLRDSKNIMLSGLRSVGYNTVPLLCIHDFECSAFPWREWWGLTAYVPASYAPLFVAATLLLRIVILFVLYKLWKFVMKKWKEHKRGGTNVVILED